jgi:hypothetical protein
MALRKKVQRFFEAFVRKKLGRDSPLPESQLINLSKNILYTFDTVPITSLYDLLTPN